MGLSDELKRKINKLRSEMFIAKKKLESTDLYLSDKYAEYPSDSSKYFYVADGMHLKSINDLESYLWVMSDDTFAFHTQKKNEFAEWVRDVFDMKDLAREMKRATTREELISIINNFKG